MFGQSRANPFGCLIYFLLRIIQETLLKFDFKNLTELLSYENDRTKELGMPYLAIRKGFPVFERL